MLGKTIVSISMLFVAWTCPLPAQQDWINQLSASFGQVGNAAAADAAGNAYVTGYFTGQMTIADQSLDGLGFGDAYLLSYTADGDLRWAVQSEGQGWNGGRDIAIDAAGNVYLTGRIEGEAQFGDLSVTGVGDNDVFLLKYDAAGREVWLASGGGPGADWANGIALAPDGDVLITGFFSDDASFGGQTISSKGDHDCFVARYDREGELVWLRSGGGSGVDEAFDLAVDADGNATLAGVLSGQAQFGEFSFDGGDTGNGFVLQYDAGGSVTWGELVRTPAGSQAESIETDAEGNVYVAGSFSGIAAAGDLEMTSNGESDAFLAKFSPDGTALRARVIGGTGPDGSAFFGQSIGLAVGPEGQSWIVTSFSGFLNLDISLLTSRGDVDILLAHFDADGRALWAESCGGDGMDNFVGLGVDPDGDIVFTGNYFSNPFACGEFSLPAVGQGLNTFIARFEARAVEEEPPVAGTSLSALQFGAVKLGEASTLSFDIIAASRTDLRVDGIEFSSPDAAAAGFRLLAPSPSELPTVLQEGRRLEVQVEFAPQSAGPAATLLQLHSNDPVSPVIDVSIEGSGEETISHAGGDPQTAELLAIRPNPAAGTSMIEFNAPRAGSMRLALYDSAGRRVYRQQQQLHDAGLQRIPLDTSGLPGGLYNCIVRMGGLSLSANLLLIP